MSLLCFQLTDILKPEQIKPKLSLPPMGLQYFCIQNPGWGNQLCKNSTLLKLKGQTEKSLYLTSVSFPMIPSLSPSPQEGSAWFVDERRSTAVTLLLQSRSLIPRFTACPKQMGDSGNWHQGLQHAVMALSPEIRHLYLSSCCLLSVCQCQS